MPCAAAICASAHLYVLTYLGPSKRAESPGDKRKSLWFKISEVCSYYTGWSNVKELSTPSEAELPRNGGIFEALHWAFVSARSSWDSDLNDASCSKASYVGRVSLALGNVVPAYTSSALLEMRSSFQQTKAIYWHGDRLEKPISGHQGDHANMHQERACKADVVGSCRSNWVSSNWHIPRFHHLCRTLLAPLSLPFPYEHSCFA